MAVKASAQVSIVDISDAYNVILTSESYTFTGNTSGATSGLSCSTQVVAYCGSEQCGTVAVGTITCPTGISATITNNKTKTPTITFKTTATVTSACQATIPVTVDGVTINKKFSFAVAKTGSTGNGIKAITEHYAVSSSNTATPIEWFDYVMVTNSVERYLWYYETITYTNGTSADGKKRVIGTYGEKGDGLDIKDTRATNESPNWYIKNYPKTTVMEFKECKVIGLSNVGTYCNLQTIVLWSDNTVGYPRQTAKIEGTGKEYWRVGISNTTWSSWIDPYGKSLEAAKTATDFMEFTSGDGLQIGDKTNGTWKGFRSRITSTAFEILNEAGTAVASYGRKLIQLGKDTTDAVIELCGGKGKISYQSNVKIGDVIDDYISISSGSLMLNATKGITLKNNSPDSDKGGENFRSYVQFLYHTFALYMSNTVNDIYNCSRVLVERKMIELGVMGGKSKYAGILISANDVTGNYNVSIDGTNVYINNKSFLDRTYPVGSIYMSTNATNPTDLFGGTWVAWGAGRVPVGFNGGDGNFNSSEKTGGSKTINIEHNHGLSNARAAVGRADSSLSTMSYTSGGNPHNVYFDREFSYYGGISGGHKHATDTSLIYGNTNNGGSTSAPVLQPYIVCYMWKRTA